LASLVSTSQPAQVLAEILLLLKMIDEAIDPAPFVRAFNDVQAMFEGKDARFQPCNTGYHNLRHTLDVCLAAARLIHGAVAEGQRFAPDGIINTLIAAIFHDVGYLQERGDDEGTGAKFTATHVERGMAIFQHYAQSKGFAPRAVTVVQSMILCTSLAVNINAIAFDGAQTAMLAKILGSADLLAQAADRLYLEKLLFLYDEFKEAGVGDYTSEKDLLEKTIGFFDYCTHRVQTVLGGVDRFMHAHFAVRWHINVSLYHEAIAHNKKYLRKILAVTDTDPLDLLKRSGIVTQFRGQDHETG
jgi:hypothetical protein